MNRAVAHYRRALKRKLPCTNKVRIILLDRFQSMLDSFLEECPDPTQENLHTAFGTPETMAKILSAGISERDRTRYAREKWLKRIAAGIVAAILIALTGYIWFMKDMPLNTVDETYIYPIVTSPPNSTP